MVPDTKLSRENQEATEWLSSGLRSALWMLSVACLNDCRSSLGPDVINRVDVPQLFQDSMSLTTNAPCIRQCLDNSR